MKTKKKTEKNFEDGSSTNRETFSPLKESKDKDT